MTPLIDRAPFFRQQLQLAQRDCIEASTLLDVTDFYYDWPFDWNLLCQIESLSTTASSSSLNQLLEEAAWSICQHLTLAFNVDAGVTFWRRLKLSVYVIGQLMNSRVSPEQTPSADAINTVFFGVFFERPNL